MLPKRIVVIVVHTQGMKNFSVGSPKHVVWLYSGTKAVNTSRGRAKQNETATRWAGIDIRRRSNGLVKVVAVTKLDTYEVVADMGCNQCVAGTAIPLTRRPDVITNWIDVC